MNFVNFIFSVETVGFNMKFNYEKGEFQRRTSNFRARFRGTNQIST